VINRAHAAIGLSATLSPPEFYTGLLGFAAGPHGVRRDRQPVPAGKPAVVIDPTVATTFRARPLNYDRIAERLASFADSVPGNCLALFPSYAFLSEITGRMRLRNKRVLVQRQADNEKERDLLLQALRSAIFGDILLVAGGGRRLRGGRGLSRRGLESGGRSGSLPAGDDPGATAPQGLLRRALREGLRIFLRGAGNDPRRPGRRPA